jgi:hypothetical protein
MECSYSKIVVSGWKSGSLEPRQCRGRDTRFSASGPKGRSISKRVLIAAINGRSSTVALSIRERLKATVHALVSANV